MTVAEGYVVAGLDLRWDGAERAIRVKVGERSVST